jgi:hypothetical protein
MACAQGANASAAAMANRDFFQFDCILIEVPLGLKGSPRASAQPLSAVNVAISLASPDWQR